MQRELNLSVHNDVLSFLNLSLATVHGTEVWEVAVQLLGEVSDIGGAHEMTNC